MDPLEDSNGDKKSLFQLDHATKIFLLTLVDAMLLFTVFVLAFSWYQAGLQLNAMNDQVRDLQERFRILEQLQQNPESQKEVIDSSTWKTYQNEEYKFEMKYPSDWVISQSHAGRLLSLSKNDDRQYTLTVGYITQDTSSNTGVTYCQARPEDSPRCESTSINSIHVLIDWGILNTPSRASAWVAHPQGGNITFIFAPLTPGMKHTFYQILSTFKFIE